jgi:phage terminase small subunit
MATKKAPTLTAKQEAFCQAIVSGMSQADAYRKAYDAGKMKADTIQQAASRLMADSKVSARVQELRAPVVAELQYDLKAAMLEAEDALKVAKSREQAGAMVAAVQLRAKLNGLLIEKREDVTDPLKKAIGNMPAEKAQEMLDALAQVEAVRKKAASAA